LDNKELIHLVREVQHSAVWRLALEELKAQKERLLKLSLTAARSGGQLKSDYYLGSYSAIEEVAETLLDRVIENLEERKD